VAGDPLAAVDGRVAADAVDADVGHVVDQVVRHAEAVDVAVDRQGFAHAQLALVDLVVVDGQVRHGRRGRAVDGDAHRLRAVDGGDAVAGQGDGVGGAPHAEAGAVVAGVADRHVVDLVVGDGDVLDVGRRPGRGVVEEDAVGAAAAGVARRDAVDL